MTNYQDVYQQWLAFDGLESSLKIELSEMMNDEVTIKEAFYAPLEFGTAGMRGILGAGINRMNIYTVRQATAGLAQLIKDKGEQAMSRGVVIAYDSRHQSPEFALEAARVLAKQGIKAYVFEALRPTPELSFGVRELNAIAGIMITASHNPKEYNGYKVYGEDGGQMPPHDANTVIHYIRKIDNPLTVGVADKNDSLIEMIGSEIDERYLAEMKAVTIDHELISRMSEELQIVYTPLHGTGKMLVERGLAQAGFDRVEIVPEQAEPDADFSTVVSPNPEEYSAFEKAIELAERVGADVLMATDPDADRVGAAVRLANGEYQILTGNQLGVLMLDYILNALQEEGTLPTNGVALKSIVSTEMARAVAQDYGIEMVDVLTGFKFIAEKIQQYEDDKTKTFLFGFEESYGYLVKDFARDKDAVQAVVLLAEVAAYYKEKGMTLHDGLMNLYTKYGTYLEETISVTMPGVEGVEKIKNLMKSVRELGMEGFGGIGVTVTEDFLTGTRTHLDGKVEEMLYPSSDVLKYFLVDGSWVAIRPSGTEPKIKFYIAAKAGNHEEASEKIAKIKETIAELQK
ncbi:phospho-sugar mutase [Vagococcus xieshaowenii]|uniref:Phosphoglucomutase n=1 Tax=Vagococcus xieshaowenii TaxID=2562451 RepID=A0AAJ5EE17_9ENTE|nr:phospho-sugar mutase [Vagococcus xieshaowenii]QCA29154.1 phospho-sugar mutase [Vagococcus xieshaowenii]TFZ40869.1 phospho-sugar mutase [Vagococcus xieshaowenii]